MPQSEKFVVERLGRLRTVLGPGTNFILPFLDRVAHRISILERQPSMNQDAITSDNGLVAVETSVFYRIIEPHLWHEAGEGEDLGPRHKRQLMNVAD